MRPATLVLLGTCLLLAGPARTGDQIIDIHLTDKVTPGKQPALTITAFADIESLVLDLKRDDGKRVKLEKNNVPRNGKRTLTLPQTKGRHRYRGTLAVTLMGGGGGTMKLDFVALIMPGLGLSVRQGDLDLEAERLKLRSKRPLARVDYEIVADNGKTIGQGTFEAEQAAKVLEVPWEQEPGKVLKIVLVAHDQEGFTQELSLFPWSYSIPHDELVFETGKWDVLPSEAPKLDKSFELLQQGLEKYGKLLPVKLYIAGYTDTVAAADYNLGLSEKRALAIARYFRTKGFSFPIYYQGFGERGLKVPTGDGVDEPKNRRAEYLLAAQPPHLSVPGSHSRWKRL